MMEYWNVGMLKIHLRRTGISGMASVPSKDGKDQNIKSDQHPLLIPNIPFFHASIIPLVIEHQKPTIRNEIIV